MVAGTETRPHAANACGGNFQDWLEVNLLPECNGRCSWCIERRGYHPTQRASWQAICAAALATEKRNVILLGGEPTLYPGLRDLVRELTGADRRVWLTTNGALLGQRWREAALDGIAGVNISIHHYELSVNARIVGVALEEGELRRCIGALRAAGARVRFNCNLMGGHIDSADSIRRYLAFARGLGASHVRFAELKGKGGAFVDLCDVLGPEHGLTADPFADGCNHDTELDGMPVNLRQMCGLQTPRRPRPINPVQCAGQVLYYDGHLYRGWQCPGGLDAAARRNLLHDLASGRVEVKEALGLLAPAEDA